MDSKKITIRHMFNLEYGRPPLLERFILLFCTLHTIQSPMGKVFYKYFLDRLYIIKREMNPGLPAPQLVIPWNGGADRPWMN